MRISAGGPCLLLLLLGCGSVDVRPEVSEFSASVNTATAPLAADLAARTAAEEAAAREAAIAAGKEIYDPPIGCLSVATLTEGAKLDDCQLVTLNPAPVAPGSAKAMLAYSEVLTAYAGALTLLATSDAPDKVGKAFGGLLTSVEGLVAVVPDMAPFTQKIAKARPPLTTLGQRLAEAQRMRLIRQLVRDAGPGVTEVLDRLIAYRDADDGLLAAADALNASYGRMEDARRSGNQSAFAAAVSDYEATHAALRSRLVASDAGRLVLIREAQQKLEDRLAEPADLESYVSLIETLKALSDALSS
jgi:hypothetical protein